jgi:hypothetical protein
MYPNLNHELRVLNFGFNLSKVDIYFDKELLIIFFGLLESEENELACQIDRFVKA